MTSLNNSENAQLKVFISYSRTDDTFAQELLSGLQAAGFLPFLDKHDIIGGEDWEARLQGLIESADTVVFVMSPESIRSTKCDWEINYALGLKKRLLPIMWRETANNEVPSRLQQLNYIFFNRANAFGQSLLALSIALKTDVDWIREHTRIGAAALRWKDRDRPDELLFGGDELASAQDWVKQQPKFAAEPTLLMLEFLRASDDSRRQRQAAEKQRLDDLIAANVEREAALKKERSALEKAQVAVRKVQRWQLAATLMLVCVMISAVVAYQWSRIKFETNWLFIVAPYKRENFDHFLLPPDKEAQLATGEPFRECRKDCPEMVVLKAGRFTMGSYTGPEDSEEKPLHEVNISHFAVSKNLVTFDEWDACAAVNVCPQIKTQYGRGTQPVINVTFEDAKIYIAWLQRVTDRPYRLLSEAEWEYAARSGTKTLFPWGDEPGTNLAHCRDCKSLQDRNMPASVQLFPPNKFGLYDMHGNVSQWCEDTWHENYIGAPSDEKVWIDGIKSLRVVRGGSWNKSADSMRSANRGYMQDDGRSDEVGIRIARTLTR